MREKEKKGRPTCQWKPPIIPEKIAGPDPLDQYFDSEDVRVEYLL
jgi:hypothetical protein